MVAGVKCVLQVFILSFWRAYPRRH